MTKKGLWWGVEGAEGVGVLGCINLEGIFGAPVSCRSNLSRSQSKPIEGHIPKIVLLDATNSPHFPNFGPGADNLYAYMSSRLNDGVLVVCELRRSSVGVPLDIARNQLSRPSEPTTTVSTASRARVAYMC